MLLERLTASGGSSSDHGGRVMELALPATPRSVSEARRALNAYCRNQRVPTDAQESGELLISELVTNAVQHAGTPCLVWAEYDTGQLTIAVLDGESTSPTVAPFDAGERYGGRGMPLIETLGCAWGTATTRLGKVVWVTIAPAAAPLALPEQRGQPTGTLPD